MKRLIIPILFLLISCEKLTDEYNGELNTMYTVVTDCYGFTAEYTMMCSETQTYIIEKDSIYQFEWEQGTNVMDTTTLILKVKTLCTGNIKATINYKNIQVSDSCFGWGCEIELIINK